eukprot:TRINITY_DN6482_c0_g1_i1.p1 TRINITY_DN6482_c0_g1~~TRINITY_DN6482_c0_g1_i1.p1  ORF type:complete len:322 (-),score=102.63 TRINITY_DN6482_c0_g1_i1:25-990(-)
MDMLSACHSFFEEPVLQHCLLTIGIVAVAFYFLKVIRFVYSEFLRPAQNLRRYGGDYVVITGATDGIGLGFAHVLADKGHNLVLIARNQNKLNAVKAEIAPRARVTVVTICADFANMNEADWEKLESQLSGNISILINNVGTNVEYPSKFLDSPVEMEKIMHDVNVVSMQKMTRIVLPKMINRRQGAIINLSSAMALSTMPLFSLYAGSKAYTRSFTKALAAEVKSYGIDVMCATPYFVVSQLSKIRKPSLTVPTPKSFAKSTLGHLGYTDETCGFWAHTLIRDVINGLPEFIVTGRVKAMHEDIRRRALAKKARMEKKDE